ncbi:hypothetical protein D0T11_09510 [Hymenobacter rubripertinctus]|uniref:Uncharacterized protein n=1 Tax=Hymenobacter rubripertinctus TaxID=2029981 RepID=A0A418QZ45_9BACT|nr:hypothetical protein D0T11_09510 [Hymenobacter rubripertinctus]
MLTACAPTRVLSLQPTGGGSGPARDLVSHPDSVYVRFWFLRAEQEELVFQAEFSNAGAHAVTVNPATFYYQPRPDSLHALALGRRPARDPEAFLTTLAARRDQEAAKANGSSWFELLTMVVNTVEDVASIKKDETKAQEEAREARHQDDQIYFDSQRAGHADEAQALHTAVAQQATSMLRQATLQPGDQVRGLVYFPRLDSARQLEFVLFFDERPLQYYFTQKVL